MYWVTNDTDRILVFYDNIVTGRYWMRRIKLEICSYFRRLDNALFEMVLMWCHQGFVK